MQLPLIFVNPKFFAPIPFHYSSKQQRILSLNSGFRPKSNHFNLGSRKMTKLNKASASLEEEEEEEGSSSNSVNDSSSLQSTLNKLSKWVVAGIFGMVIIWKHDAEVLWAAMGSVVNSWLSITLKKILNHSRPSDLGSGPGMPSSHAQSIFFASAFAILAFVQWLGVNYTTLMIALAILAFSSYLSWLRVSEQLHTPNQVLVGALLGSAMGIMWFWLWHAFVLSAFVSSFWVRVVVVIGSLSFCGAFVIYVIQNWLSHER